MLHARPRMRQLNCASTQEQWRVARLESLADPPSARSARSKPVIQTRETQHLSGIYLGVVPQREEGPNHKIETDAAEK